MKKLLYILPLLMLVVSCESKFQTWRELNEDYMNSVPVRLGKTDDMQPNPYVLRTGELTDGVLYEVYHDGYGATPKVGYNTATGSANSAVFVKYQGWTVDGQQFDASSDTVTGAWFYMPEVVEGWQSALSQMKEGSHWKIYVPSSCGYGGDGSADGYGVFVIPPYSTLIFDIELIEVVNN